MNANSKTSLSFLLLAISLMALMINIDYTAVNLALIPMANELNANLQTIQWVLSGYILAWAILVIPVGKTIDIYGAKKICLFGLGLFLLASLIAGLATTSTMLITGRFIQGIAGAFYVPTLYAFIYACFPQEKRGFAIGMFSLGVGLGMAIGPTFGGIILTWIGWRWIFFINVPIVLLCGFIFYKQQEEKKVPQKNTKNISLIQSLLQNNSYIGIILAMGLEQYAFASLTVMISIYLQRVIGQTALNASIIFLALTLVFGVVSPLGGKLVDRFSIKPVISIGMLVLALGTFSFIYLINQPSTWMIIVTLVIMGAGMGLAFSALNTGVVTTVNEKEVGIASSIFLVFALLGNTLGITISTLIYEFVSYHHLTKLVSSITLSLNPAQLFQLHQLIKLVGASDYHLDAFNPNLQSDIINFLPQAFSSGITTALAVCLIAIVLSVFTAWFLIGKKNIADYQKETYSISSP